MVINNRNMVTMKKISTSMFWSEIEVLFSTATLVAFSQMSHLNTVTL